MLLPSGYSTTSYGVRADAKGWGRGWTPTQTACAAERDLVVVLTRDKARLPMRTAVAELVDILIEVMESRGYTAVNGWCWGYSCRNIAGGNNPSNHSWGLAFDLNAPRNPYTSSGQHDIPASVFALFRAYGFGVGADYSGAKKDWMHFEFMGTPRDAELMTALARRAFQGGSTPAPQPQPSTPAPNTPAYPGSVLKRGSKGDAVWIMQARLNEHLSVLGQPRIGVDGDFGPGTEKAVRLYQWARKGAPFRLAVDGQVGPATWRSLWQ